MRTRHNKCIRKDNNMFPEIVYFNGKKGVHVGNGIYKLETPFKINRSSWAKDDQNSGYAIIGTNYTPNYQSCDVVYFTKHDYGKLIRLVQELNKTKPEQYGYIQALSDSDTEILGGYTIV